jgi:hypothetical protein
VISVKYKCKQDGVFAVSLDIGGRGRVGKSPSTQPCPACGEACGRLRQPVVPVSKALFERMQVYSEANRIPLSRIVEKATEDLGQ